ncbi:YqeB family protein [Nocardia sp. CA-128927]|uniref:YqeB family protein n=1 Tax=Nocardia sp. CA-128927 TaxID=3239975 RepID=UPI003D99AF69
MTTTSAPTVLRFSTIWAWLFAVGGLAIGCGIGFAAHPLGHWLTDTFDGTPGPLKVALKVPTVWLVLVLMLIGVVAGVVLYQIARTESLTLTIADDHVELVKDGRAQHVPRKHVAAVFREDTDLVLTDRNKRRLARFGANDLNRNDIENAFQNHGYPWLDQNDPFGADYVRWVEGRPETGKAIDTVLRARRHALADEKPLDVEELDEQLLELGIDVRDRQGEQHIRVFDLPG